MQPKELIEKAITLLNKSYSPYSLFKVGCVIETETGNIYGGSNIENSSYSLTICAERVACATMIMAGDSQILKVALTSK